MLYRESFLGTPVDRIPILWGLTARPKQPVRIGKTWERIPMTDGTEKGFSVQQGS